jgi:hypothetical protein
VPSAPWPRLGVFKLEAGVWMVPSATTAPGAYWLVHSHYERGVYFTCTCPAGRDRQQMQASNPCRHVRLVAEAEAADGYARRPPGRVGDTSRFVD